MSFWGAVAPNEFPGLAPGKRVFGPLRLLDVKPPCSNLAGPSGTGQFSFAARRSRLGNRAGLLRDCPATRFVCQCRQMAGLVGPIVRWSGDGGGPGSFSRRAGRLADISPEAVVHRSRAARQIREMSVDQR